MDKNVPRVNTTGLKLMIDFNGARLEEEGARLEQLFDFADKLLIH